MHSGPECVQDFFCKNSLCCGVMHQVKKLVFDVFCFLREVINLKAEGIPHEFHHWVVAFEIRKIVRKLVQQPVEVNDGFIFENVADATSSLADLRQKLEKPRHNSSFETKGEGVHFVLMPDYIGVCAL